MWKYGLVCSALACSVLVLGMFDKIISKGHWVVESIERCPDYENYPYDMNLRKKKMNRTHDVFYGELKVLDDVTEEGFGISIVTCKKVDGGCKTVTVMNDESLCRFVNKHAKENSEKFLKNMGLDGNCLVPKGTYEVKDFMFDCTELPEEGMVGRFLVAVYILKLKEKIACLSLHVFFDEDEE